MSKSKEKIQKTGIFASNLVRILDQKDIRQKNLADAIGVPANSINNYIKNYSAPKIDMALKIADYLGVSLDELMGRKVDSVRKLIRKFISTNDASAINGAYVLALRNQLNLSQDELAEIINVHPNMVKDWESEPGKLLVSEMAYKVTKFVQDLRKEERAQEVKYVFESIDNVIEYILLNEDDFLANKRFRKMLLKFYIMDKFRDNIIRDVDE